MLLVRGTGIKINRIPKTVLLQMGCKKKNGDFL
jgi:hypothetical protein